MKCFKLVLSVMVVFSLLLTGCNTGGNVKTESVSANNPSTVTPSIVKSTPIPSPDSKLAYYDKHDFYQPPQSTSVPLSKSKYVSSKAIEIVKEYLIKDKELDLFSRYVFSKDQVSKFKSGKEIELKDLLKLSLKKDVIEFTKDESGSSAEYEFIDIDNDNQDEIFISMCLGSGAFNYMAVLEKDKSQTYGFSEYPINELLHSSSGEYSETLNLAGKNYYVETKYNESSSEGINIYAFSKGRLVENVSINKYIDSFTSSVQFVLAPKYNTLVKKVNKSSIEAILSSFDDKEYYSNYEAKSTKEEVQKLKKDFDSDISFWRKTDINNDGISDYIFKYFYFSKQRDFMFYAYTKEKLIDFKKTYKHDFLLNEPFEAGADQVWFEEFLGLNYMVANYRSVANERHSDIFLLEKNKYTKIGEVKIKQVIQPTVEVWSEGYNIKFDHLTEMDLV